METAFKTEAHNFFKLILAGVLQKGLEATSREGAMTYNEKSMAFRVRCIWNHILALYRGAVPRAVF